MQPAARLMLGFCIIAVLGLTENDGRADDTPPHRTVHLTYFNTQWGKNVTPFVPVVCYDDGSCRGAQYQTSIDEGDWNADVVAYVQWFWPGPSTTVLRWSITEVQRGTMKECGTGTLEAAGSGTFDFATGITQGNIVLTGVAGDLADMTGTETVGPGVQDSQGNIIAQPAVATVKCRKDQ